MSRILIVPPFPFHNLMEMIFLFEFEFDNFYVLTYYKVIRLLHMQAYWQREVQSIHNHLPIPWYNTYLGLRL